VQKATNSTEFPTECDPKADIAALRSDIHQFAVRIEAKLEAIKADILNRIFEMIAGALVVNIIAEVGAMFAVAKLVGH
jgi:hypothetical protein